MSIFKAYDVRGVYPGEINEEIAYRIGRALVIFIKCNEICVGRDARPSSPKLFSALVKGITEQGADVIDIGLCSTPLFYFAAKEYEGGIMVTASHNPAKYNGFKICRNGTIPVGGESGLKEIEKLIQENKFQDSEIKGSIFKKDYLKDFVEFCMAHQGNIKKLKIVVDTGNGMGGYFFPKIFENMHQVSLIPLFWKVDMTFPNHEADPLKPENMKDLQEAVKKHKADLGIALDGDADRIFFVDEKGEIVPAYFITALIGLEMLKEKPSSSMGYDIRSSKIVRELWEKAGAKVTITRVGHSLIKETMRKEHLLFVGEVSGHYFYEDTDYAENTGLTALKVLNIMSEQNKPLSEIIKPLKKYSQSGEINFEVADKELKMKHLEEIYKGKAKHINWLDGITAEFKDWWFNVRSSNTEPLLRLNLEANTKELMEEKVKEVEEIIKA